MIDYQLYFCTDGVLRAKWSEKTPMLSVTYIQEATAYSHLSFWSQWWNKEAHFEEGLTIGEFLECLKPWESFWSELLNKDVIAYIKESKQLILIDNCSHLDWIELGARIEFSPITKRIKNDNESLEDFIKSLNQKQERELTGEWKYDQKYYLSGYQLEQEEHYSISHQALNTVANLPFYLAPYQVLCVLDQEAASLFSSQEFQHYGIKKVGESQLTYLNIEKKYTFKEIIEGFFKEMSHSPYIREQENKQIKKMLEETIIPAKEEAHIIDFETKEEVEPVVNHKQERNSIVEELEKADDFWKKLIKLSPDENALKSSLIQVAKSPEKRIFGYIIKEKDEKN